MQISFLSLPVLAGLGASLALLACNPTAGTPTQPAAQPQNPAPAATAAAPLDWEKHHPERAAWSEALRADFTARLAQIGVPADITEYCPTFATLGPQDRAEVLSTMAVAIARRESSYDPTQVYHEPPPLGVDSIGLFQLSYEDGYSWCSLDKAADSLKDPQNNIACAVGEMASLIHKDGVVASGASVSGGKGLAKYWSVIQDGSGHFKSEIQARVRALPICAP
jgi:Transglycosylase SLT domain